MSFLFTLDEDNLAEQLPQIFFKYEKLIDDAEVLFKLEGQKLELIMRNLPQNQTFYSKLSHDMKQVVKWLENYKSKIEAKYTRNYSQGARALPAREAATLISGESAIVEINQLIIEANLLYMKLDSIVEGFIQMGWSCGNITKLRVAELQETII